MGALGKELWKLRKLRNHFSVQEESEGLIDSQSVGKGKAFCEKVAEQSGVLAENPGFDRWKNSVNPAHSDAEILDMYDSMVVSQQDKLATKIVSQHATESAALVAVSPLAAADMLLVAWRNFKMIDNLSKVYGVELGYASRIKLLRAVFVNMAAAGASELAIDASMDSDVDGFSWKSLCASRAGFGCGYFDCAPRAQIDGTASSITLVSGASGETRCDSQRSGGESCINHDETVINVTFDGEDYLTPFQAW